MNEQTLCNLAIEAMKNAYAPYSHHLVGAALLTKSGKVYCGCNIENVSYTPTVCAERTAFFKAVSEGETAFSMLAVAGGAQGELNGICSPCGVCRQVIAEFCDADFPILMVRDANHFEKTTLGELLPFAFQTGKGNQ